MATPRVFVSSTCYDLKYIRENLKYFIRTLGYEPILSEEGDVYFSPSVHTHEACLSEVASCQIMVLIIGGRHGGDYQGSDRSITNHEYEAAIESRIPVFALVELSVLSEHLVYQKNKAAEGIDETKIKYPSVDDVRIFGFIDQVRKHLINNAIVPFKDFSDIESYLRKQWAGMMYEALTSDSEAKRVGALFESLQEATQNIQFMTKQLVKGIDNKAVQLNIEFYDEMLATVVVHDFACWKIPIAPKDIIQNETFDKMACHNIEIDDKDGSSLTYGGPPYRLSQPRYDADAKKYTQLRARFLNRLQEEKLTVEEFLSEISTRGGS